MVVSMTGYGRGEMNFDGKAITIEIRSVNSRYLDCSVRIPRLYLYLEEKIKNTIQQKISRGKVEVFVGIEGSESTSVEISVDLAVAEGYFHAFAELSEHFSLKNDLTVTELASLPDVLQVEKTKGNVDESDFFTVLEQALADFYEMREREGEKLRLDMLEHIQEVLGLLETVEAFSPKSVIEYQQKLEQRMKALLDAVPVDQGRLMTEVALFADKVAVDEETVRLRSHLAQLKDLLQQGGTVGRKLDFLIQECNREANTIGSKCSDLEITRCVVEIKAAIEKMREQTQNIE
ncbi:MAG: YicC/YloC family endoribonuclease [Eubacteriales bacterium]